MTGNFENFNDGGWNGDVNNYPANTRADLAVRRRRRALHDEQAIYLSPQFYGVDFGVSL